MGSSEPYLSFECSACEDIVVASGFELPGFDYSAEIHSDGRGFEAVSAECSTCDKEYVVEISNMFDQFEAEVSGEPEIKVSLSAEVAEEDYDEESYRDYLKAYVPEEPGERYRHSLRMLDEMVAAAGQLTSYPTFQRMLFLQNVAMMEAYLGDRLLTLVKLEEVQTNLIKRHKGLGSQTYSLEAFASVQSLIDEKTAGFLKAQLYHELDAVEKLFEAALGLSPFPDGDTKTFLKKAMINRHHCVHRDGKDNSGAVIVEVDAPYVHKVRDCIASVVAHVEANCADKIDRVRPPSLF
jgi:hypothetical protein